MPYKQSNLIFATFPNHLIGPEADLNLADMSFAQKEHTQPPLPDGRWWMAWRAVGAQTMPQEAIAPHTSRP